MMKNELEMALSSRRILTESTAREQITALCNFGDAIMRPDRASEFEPIKAPFDPTDLSDAIRWLTKPQGEFLYRQGKPLHLSGQMWNRILPPSSPFPSPTFSNYWTGQFDGEWTSRCGIENVEAFVSEMFRVTGSDFALLTTTLDRKVKNQGPMSHSYQGTDLASGIPGLYWINFFSDDLAAWIRLSSIPKEIAKLKRMISGGWSLKFCESQDNCRDMAVLQKQRYAIEWFGSDKFFDIRFPDRKLSTPDWDNMPRASMV
ncbi:MAG: hypothetical protein V4555_20495 [Acidobacteriota bacterium]